MTGVKNDNEELNCENGAQSNNGVCQPIYPKLKKSDSLDEHSHSPPNEPNTDEQHLCANHGKTIKVYKIRYFLLLMFISLSLSNAFQWIEYAIIESVITDYYQVSTFWINCTSVVYMASYIIGIMPATWLLEKYGLRTYLILGAFANALGSWIKCLSIDRSRFWVTMIGQTISACAQLFILNVPPLLAAVWFPSKEVTRATAFGVFGNQVGIAVGFLVPPLLMPSSNSTNATESTVNDDINDLTERGLKYLFFGVASVTTLILITILIFFKKNPQHPPSESQAFAQSSNEKRSFSHSLKSLFTNTNFILLLISYGLNTGVFYALSTVLSQMITRSMGDEYLTDAGYMGLTLTLSGIVGSVVCGYILGWSGKYKMVTFVIYLFSLLGTVAFTVSIELQSIVLLFISCVALGFFMTGYLPIGFEFAAEISYPQPEGTSAGLLNTSAQVNKNCFRSVE